MLTSKWHMHRMGLIDFWYYFNEEFLFKDGHILLRGSNGSGKSVTMQSFIPLLLDGNKSSERLDSFGTRARKIETYLIDEESDRNDRIGYLYLEFKREDSDIYKTIGMGLRARKNKPLDTWYFVIEDNRRINHDIQLIDHNLAITKQSLKNIIGDQVIETQKEYMDKVNQALFCFPSRDEYKEAINLLVQLRSPKLSNSLKPAKINEMLSDSLRPLSEEDLRPMSEALSNMDEIQDQLNALKQSFAAAKNISNILNQYNFASLDKKALHLIRQNDEYNQLNLKKENQQKQKEQNILNHKTAIQTKQKLLDEQEILKEEYTSLVKQDLMQLVSELEDHKNKKDIETNQLHKKKQQFEEKDNLYIDIKAQFEAYQQKAENKDYEINKVFQNMEDIQKEIDFEEHYALKNEFIENLEKEYSFEYTNNRIKHELNSLDKGSKLFSELNTQNKFVERVYEEKEKKQSEIEDNDFQIKQHEEKFYSLQEEYKEKFSQWSNKNTQLTLSHGDLLQIFQYIQSYMDKDEYHKIDEIINNNYLNIINKLSNNLSSIKRERTDLKSQISEAEHQLRYWRELKDPLPIQDEYTQSSRIYLQTNNIDYKPLYTLLEYDDSLDETFKDQFEEYLLRMGILDALIINEANKETIFNMPKGMADQFIFTNKSLDSLEAYYLKSADDFLAALKSLGIDSSSIKFYKNSYQNGIINGTISSMTKNTFIGQNARKSYKEAKIKYYEDALNDLWKKDQEQEKAQEEYEVSIAQAKKEVKTYPTKANLETIKNTVQKLELIRSTLIERIKTINEEIKKYKEAIQKTYLQITKIAEELKIAPSQEVFDMRINNFKEYQIQLNELQSLHVQYLSFKELEKSNENRMEDIRDDRDILTQEISMIKANISKLETLIMTKQKQLDELGYQEIQKRIEEIQNRNKEIPEEISHQDQLIGNLTKSISQIEDSILLINAEIVNQTKNMELAKEAYEEEVNLKYVVTEDKTVDKVHAMIKKQYPNLKSKETLGNELQTVFYTNRGYLQEYGLRIFSLFEEKEENTRLDINARYQGKRINFNELTKNLSNDIEQQSLLLEESDRNLIEDILVNTLSRKIRLLIQNSKRWVETMNRYMRSMDTSSGLYLSLKWKSHKADNEDELSSENLVKLLEKDIRILKETDLKHLSSHFRSKIQTARKLAVDESTKLGFHQIMKQVMDYRNWFDFQIWYEKTGEGKKELTNNAFYTFSGGEKAMAMYVPLFSAVAAKFDQAAEDAPLLIALDEAFAGVDEKNINNMFSLIKKFNFDYIMNSQVLWGDYPSVDSLAIHELFRPDNAHYVTIISYEWNGKQKRMVNR